jgi:localization factor PodJL
MAKQEAEHASGHEDLALDASAQAETRATLDALQIKIAEAVPEGVGQQGESFATEPAQSGTEETAPRNGGVLPTHAAQSMEAMPERFSEFESPAAASSSPATAEPHGTSFPNAQAIASNQPSREPSRRAPEPAHNNAAAANFQRPAASASHLPEKKHEPAAGSSFSAIPSISVWNRKGASLPASPGLQKDGAPLFPPGRDENIFARPSKGFEPEVERKHSGALLVVAIVIAVAAVGAFYLRTYRQEVGNAIAQIGDRIAGSSAANSNAAATAAPVSTATSHTIAPLKPTLPSVQSSPAKTQGPNAAQSTSIPVAAKQGAGSSSSPSATSASLTSAAGGNATVAARPSGAASPNKTLAQTAAKPSSLQAAHGPSKNQNAATASASSLLAAQSEYQRGEQYLNGTGVTQDYAQAAQWFWRSLEAGYTNAALPLANLYLDGNGVSRSCTQARILLDVAAQKNNTQAIQQLAQLPDNCQ